VVVVAGVIVTDVPLVTAPTPLLMLPVPPEKIAVRVVELPATRGLRAGRGGTNFFFGMRKVYRKDFATGDRLRLSLYTENVSVLLDGDADVNLRAIFMGRAITAGGQRCGYL
jgi:hypothetical protein